MALAAGRIIGTALGGIMDAGQAFGELAPIYGQYALGAGMMGAGTALGAGANAAGSILGSKFGQAGVTAAGTTLGGMAMKGMYNVFTGNGPVQRRRAAASGGGGGGGCSCGPSKPKPSCEEKCAYGRMMAEKCRGCKGYTGKGPGGYKRRYGPGGYGSSGYSTGYRSAAVPYGGSKPRVAGRQYRKSTKTTGRQTRKTMRVQGRQTRKTNRQYARQQKRR